MRHKPRRAIERLSGANSGFVLLLAISGSVCCTMACRIWSVLTNHVGSIVGDCIIIIVRYNHCALCLSMQVPDWCDGLPFFSHFLCRLLRSLEIQEGPGILKLRMMTRYHVFHFPQTKTSEGEAKAGNLFCSGLGEVLVHFRRSLAQHDFMLAWAAQREGSMGLPKYRLIQTPPLISAHYSPIFAGLLNFRILWSPSS